MCALLLRALVPAGFMAAPIAEGWLLQLCPSGMAMSSYMALTGVEAQSEQDHSRHAGHSKHANHSDHSDHSDHSEHSAHGDSDLEPACGLNAGFSAVLVEPDLAPDLAESNSLLIPPGATVRLPRAPPAANRSRAPPVFS